MYDYVYSGLHDHGCLLVDVCVLMYVCMVMYVGYACMYACMHACMYGYVCMYVCMLVYTVMYVYMVCMNLSSYFTFDICEFLFIDLSAGFQCMDTFIFGFMYVYFHRCDAYKWINVYI